VIGHLGVVSVLPARAGCAESGDRRKNNTLRYLVKRSERIVNLY